MKTHSKNPKKCSLYICFAPDKKIIPNIFRIRGILVFFCPKERQRERGSGGRGGETEREEREKEKERAREKKKEKEREREREKECRQLYF
jgi:hypothetical protein